MYLDLIKRLTLSPGISGDERRIAEILKEEIAIEYKQDNMGSISFEKKGSSENPKIMLLAHMDEIGFIVADITRDGFIKMQNIGGWNPKTLLSSPVEIINSDNEIYPGIIGSLPVHFSRKKSTQNELKIEDMFIDIGATSDKDVIQKFGIKLGDSIIPITNFHYSKNNNLVFSKAFDDRIGVAALAAVGSKIQNESHPNTVHLVGSVQEEVGTRGALSIAGRTDADICIVIEGAPADDFPGVTQNPQTALGKGVHLRIFDPTLIVKKELKDQIINIAEDNQIKYQPTVRRAGGTDGRVLHTANYGIPTIVLGVPVRYAHSHNCIASLDDFSSLIELLYQIILKIDNNILKAIL